MASSLYSLLYFQILNCRTCSKWCRSQLFRDSVGLYLVTFLFILPFLCRNLRHSPYEIFFSKNKTAEKIILIANNEYRFNHSVSLLKKMHNYTDIRVNATRHKSQKTSSPISNGIAVTIITIARNKAMKENYRPHYLVQSVATFVKLIKKADGVPLHFSICNVDSDPRSHTDMDYIPKWITVFHRFSKNNASRHTVLSYNDLLDKEKEDYVFCLEKAFEQNLTYALLVEDDTLPRADLFPVIKAKILAANAEERRRNSLGNVLYVKLYHPERLLGYFSLEIERIPELFCLAVIVSSILVRVYTKWRHDSRPLCANVFVVFFIYSLCVLFLIGRQNILKVRLFSQHLYQMTPAPSCCTPAMLFPRAGGEIVMQYLRGVTCHRQFGKDIALDRLVRERRHITRLIQPNLFQHIGHYSSLRSAFINPFWVE